jgi:hypothetical protein
MEVKQTAVEWFQDQIIKIVNGTCQLSEIQIFEQAKEMEKVEKETEYRRGFQDGKQYYKEEYGNKR